ncbi:hypothetical protein HUU40_09725 [candidate division KSB1 bacterium]|nr:hypothetical protein [candidate division KSB1 bacterium]
MQVLYPCAPTQRMPLLFKRFFIILRRDDGSVRSVILDQCLKRSRYEKSSQREAIASLPAFSNKLLLVVFVLHHGLIVFSTNERRDLRH